MDWLRCDNCNAVCDGDRLPFGLPACSPGCEKAIIEEIRLEEQASRELEHEIADDAVGVPSGSGRWFEEDIS